MIVLITGFIIYSTSGQEIIYNREKAVAFSFPKPQEEVRDVQVFLQGKTNSILGKVSVQYQEITFTPTLPFQPGQSYELYWNGDNKLVFTPKTRESIAPIITDIYPKSDTFPENLLKIYIEFSTPMRANESYRHITVLDSDENEITPFLDLKPELWNYENTIMTLWLDPGRIKKDLLRNQKLGKPLTDKKSYHLLISANWESKAGGMLDSVYHKSFFVSEKDTESPEPENWKLSIPKANTRNPLIVDFNESLDHQLVKECFKASISGSFSVGELDRSISFVPNSPWLSGSYEIAIESRLEDLAGNNLNRVFDRDILTQDKKDQDSYTITFKIK